MTKKTTRIETQIADIVQRLSALRTLSPEKPHLYTVGATWSEDELARLEQEAQVSLPAAYRAYLRHVGDGGASFLWHGHDGDCGTLRTLRNLDGSERAALARPFPLTAASKKFQAPRDGLLLLGATSDHAECFLVVSGKAAGQVWVDGTPYDGGAMRREWKGFLEAQLAWLDERLAAEHDLKDPPDLDRFRALSLLEKLRYLRIPKNTTLLVEPEVAEALTADASRAWASKHGGSSSDTLERIAWGAIERGLDSPEADRRLLTVAAELFPRNTVFFEVGSGHASSAHCDSALAYGLAGDWPKAAAAVARAAGERIAIRTHSPNRVALLDLASSRALGGSPTTPFVPGTLGAIVGRIDVRRFAALQRLVLLGGIRDDVLRDAPAGLLLNLLLLGFDVPAESLHGVSTAELRRQSIAGVRRSFGKVVAPLRDLAVRAAAGTAVVVVAGLLSQRDVYEQELVAAKELASAAAQLAGAAGDTALQSQLEAFDR